MNRSLRILLPIALAAVLPAVSGAQNSVLKPFRPGGQPAADDPPAAVPLKPFRPGDPEVPKAIPVKPPADPAKEPEPEIPRAIPLKKPMPTPAPVPAPKPVPDPVPSLTPKPPVLRPLPEGSRPGPIGAEIPDPGDIVVGRPGTPTSADQVQMQYADGFFARKQWRDAAPEYERYLGQFPKAPAADRQAVYYRLAECYRQTGAPNNAKLNYEAILSNFNAGEFIGYAAYRLATIHYEEKDYRDALQHYRRASVKLSQQPVLMYSSRFFVGRCLEAIGQKSEARITYEDLAKVTENNQFRDASRLSAGRLFAEGAQKEQAVKWFLPLAAETSNAQIKAEATARAGLLQLELGQTDVASQTLDAALKLPEIAPWRDSIQSARYRLLYEKKNYKAVIARFTAEGVNGLSMESKLNILVTVADACRELGDRTQAMATFEQIAREFPATPQARDAGYARLVMLYDSGDPKLLPEANTFLNENPAAPQVDRVSLMKAEALFKASDFEHAAPIYQNVLAKTKSLSGNFRGEAMFKLGWCWSQLGYFDKAVGTFTEYFKEYPDHAKTPIALAQRGAAEMQLRQFAAAEKDFADLVKKYPQAREREFALENLALVQGQLGRQAAMAATFETLLTEFPNTAAKAKANYWIGRVAFDTKDYKKAAPHLDQARRLDKEQFFERGSLAIMASYYNIEDLEAVEKEIEYYKSNGGKAATPSDVIRWLGQKSFETGQYGRSEKFLPELIRRKEAVGDDYLLLARSRARLHKFKEAVESFDSYLASVKDPVPRVAGIIEKSDAQLGLKDWDGANKTVNEGLNLATEGRYNGELKLRAAEVEAGRGNLKQALQIFEAIPITHTLEDDDVNPRALSRAMEIQAKIGTPADVKRIENILRSKYPEYLQKKRLAKP